MRRCVGCMTSKPQNELMRVAFYDGKLSLDETGRAKGRGVYLCKNNECVENAQKKGAFQRSFKCQLDREQLLEVFKGLNNDER